METQNNNQHNSVKYLCDGEYLSLAQISRKKNMNYRTLLEKKNRGWDIEKIIYLGYNDKYREDILNDIDLWNDEKGDINE